MAPNDELKAHATSTFDFYELLSLPANFTQKELDRARRLTSFKYHPDKVGDDASAREKLHLTNVAYELLSDSELRSLYDNARSARDRKKASEAHLEAGRRKLKEDLEARELAGRQEAGGASVPIAKLGEHEQKVHWLAEDGKRRRLRVQARRERQHQQELEEDQQYREVTQVPKNTKVSTLDDDIPELDRSVKITFPRKANIPQPSPALLTSLLQPYGRVDSAFMVKDKHVKGKHSQESVTKGTAYVVFLKQESAVAAVRGWQDRTQGHDKEFWSTVDSINWAGGEEPEGLQIKSPSRTAPTLWLQAPHGPLQESAHSPFINGADGRFSLEQQALLSLRDAASRQTTKAG